MNDQNKDAEKAAGVPDGYAVVPIEPTPEMIGACLAETGVTSGYKAMLAAAPVAQQSAPDRVSVPVPVELALKLVRTYEDAIIDAAHWTDMDGEVTQLRALLASHGRGEA